MSAVTHFVLIRHGQTQWNLEGRLQGQLDSPLTALGETQARALGRRLVARGVDHVVTSDLPRALRTTELIVGELGSSLPRSLQIASHAGLRERHFGVLQGQRVEDLTPEHRTHYEKSRDDPQYRVPGGECRADVWDRSLAALSDVARARSGGAVVVVTHGGVLSAVLRAALGVSLHAPRTFETPNCAYNLVVFDAGVLSAQCIADTSHLDALG